MRIEILRPARSAALGLALIGGAPALAEPLKIEGVGISRDIDCDGEDVGVYGAENRIALTGNCGRVVVHGADHEVTFERARDLLVSGSKLKVRGGEAASLSVEIDQNEVEATMKPAEGASEVRISGADQKVTLTLAGPVTLGVHGADNEVVWSLAAGAPKPRISSSGAANAVKQKK